MSKPRGTNKENFDETQRVFLEIAAAEFCEFGYADASTSRIVEKSGMARGSLYYHFGDKNGLFRAVYEEAMDAAVKKVNDAMEKHQSAWDAFIAGSHAYMDLCMDTAFRKITLIESQAAMSYADRFEVQQRTLLSKLRPLIPRLMEKGYFPGHNEKTITIWIYGALGEIGRAFDFSENLEEDRKDFGQAYEKSMACLKV